MSNIPYGRQEINQDDIDAVESVLRSDFLTQGPVVPDFELAVAQYCGVQYAVAVNSATSALHIACLTLGVGPGDCVWTTPITFVATANCALYCGATIDFVDIDPLTNNISIERLAEKLDVASKAGSLPKVVIPVHLSGQPCDMASIYALSRRYHFKVIEDASHAIGGKYEGEPIGNCRYSDMTIFSFHPVKIITSGEGGMVLTKNIDWAKQLRRLRSHGIVSQVDEMQPRPAREIWNYQQVELGFNYRLTDIHAALGLSQINRLDSFVSTRHSIAQRYDQLLSGLPLSVPRQASETYSSFHLYVVRLKLNEMRKTQQQVFSELRAAQIQVNLHYIPVYRHPFYEKMGFISGYCPEAELYYSQAMSIPMFSGLTETQQDRVIAAISEVLTE